MSNLNSFISNLQCSYKLTNHRKMVKAAITAQWSRKQSRVVGATDTGCECAALIIEFCDHNIPFLKVVLYSNLVKTCAKKI